MDDNLARTISTAAIWAATAGIFILGVFRMPWQGAVGGMLWMIVAAALASAAGAATHAVWARTAQKDRASQPPEK